MEGIKCVLLDIEGTVCPISFVKETLFPYALRALPHVLATQWGSPALAPYLAAFPAEVVREGDGGGPEALRAHVEDLTRRDVKVAVLKGLQGYLWEEGYASGAYATTLFPDVAPALRTWRAGGRALAIYSSGSVFAQKLLFGHVRVAGGEGKKRGIEEVAAVEDGAGSKALRTEGGGKGDGGDRVGAEGRAVSEGDGVEGRGPETTEAGDGDHPGTDEEQQQTVKSTEDLTDMFVGWFDTTNAGLKTESSSYSKIAEALKYAPEEVLFLSDNVKEVDAALAAGMKSILVDRPGNAPLSETDRERSQIVESLGEIEVR